jgi:hypothetical protein
VLQSNRLTYILFPSENKWKNQFCKANQVSIVAGNLDPLEKKKFAFLSSLRKEVAKFLEKSLNRHQDKIINILLSHFIPLSLK